MEIDEVMEVRLINEELIELNLNLLFFCVKTTFYERLKILLSFTLRKELRKIKIKKETTTIVRKYRYRNDNDDEHDDRERETRKIIHDRICTGTCLLGFVS